MYTLEHRDGNAFAILAYVSKAMRETGFTKAEIESYNEKAKASDYNNLVRVSLKQLDECNIRLN